MISTLTNIRYLLFITLCLLQLLCLTPFAQDDNDSGSIYLEDTKSKEFLARAKAAEDKKDWKYALELYLQVATKYPHEVCKVDSNKWVSDGEFVLQKISQLPQDALDIYRFEYDAKASVQIKKAIEENDLTLLSQTIDKYFFATGVDEAIDYLANIYFEEGNLDTAILYWNRLIKYYPTSKVSLASVIAKVAVAYKLTGNDAGLDELESRIEDVDGSIDVGGKTSTLKQFLSEVKSITPTDRETHISTANPNIPSPYTKTEEQATIRNDIKRWDIENIFGEGTASNQLLLEERVMLGGRVVRRGGGSSFGPGNVQDQSLDYPYIPTYAKYGEKEYVFCQNGTTVVAFDPMNGKIYWRYPDNASHERYTSTDYYGRQIQPALLGCAVDNRTVYANLYSKKKDRQPESNRNYYARIQGPNIIQAFDAESGKLLWSTEANEELDKQVKGGNFTFSSHPVSAGNAIFAGINTILSGEQESYVCALDKRTGKLLWLTFISSLVSSQAYYYDSRGNYANLTLLTDGGSNLICLTNSGVICTIDKVNGNVIWLTKYKKPTRGNYFNRPPNYPLVDKGRIYCLPQDSHHLLVYDKNSGALLYNPEQPDMKYLIGVAGDTALLTSDRVRTAKLSEGQSLESTSVGRMGRSILHNGFVFTPSDKGLVIFDISLSKIVGEIKGWKEISDYGNIALAGKNLITVSPNSITSYSSTETITAEYADRVNSDPPNLEGVLEFANLLFDNREFEPAIKYYLKYLDFTNGFPEYKDKIAQVRTNIHVSYMRSGEKLIADGTKDLDKAIDYFTLAKSYSYDTQSFVDAVVSIAETYKEKEGWLNALDQYQEIIEKCKEGYYMAKDEDLLYSAKLHAFRAINELIKEKGKELYAKYDDLSSKQLKEASNDVDALEALVSTYPNSPSAKTALNKLSQIYKKQGNLAKTLQTARSIRKMYEEENVDVSYTIATILEEMKDYETLKLELQTLKDEMGDKVVTAVGESVTSFVDKKMKFVEDKLSEINIPLKLPLNKLTEIKTANENVVPSYAPLMPNGIVPPTLSKNIELFTDGSFVEAIDLTNNKLIWKYADVPNVEGYLGIGTEETAEGNTKIREVVPNSPGDKYRLKRGDIILAVDGKNMKTEELLDFIKKSKSGTKVTLTISRRTSKFTRDVVLGSQPLSIDKIVNAIFTSSQSLAVAYPNKVAFLNVANGRVEREYTDIPTDRVITSIHPGIDGMVILTGPKVTTPLPPEVERLRRELRVNEKLMQYQPFLSNIKLIYLDTNTGKPLWTRGLPLPITTQQNIPDPRGGEPPYGILSGQNYVAITYSFYESNKGTSSLNLLLLDNQSGKQLTSKDVIENIYTYRIDRENGRIFYIIYDRNKGTHSLHVLKLNVRYAREGKSLELWAAELDRTQQAQYQIAFNKDYLAVVAPPDKIMLWRADSGKRSYDPKLREDRAIITAPLGISAIDESNFLFIYNYASKGEGAGNRTTPTGVRAFITAYDLSDEEDQLLLWDETAPEERNSYDKYYTDKGIFAFVGRSKGSKETVAFVYDKKNGTFKILESPTPTRANVSPFNIYRNRLFLSQKETIEVYGN